MRCLYCGKQLALLKRWTGGGEFCSDAHRQSYQDEYNQLALNRLLQAKPTADNKTTLVSAAKPAEPPPVAPPPVAPQVEKPHTPPESEPATARAKPEIEPSFAARFFMELPLPAMVHALPAGSATDLMCLATPAIPRGVFDREERQVATAGRITIEPTSRVLNYATRPAEQRAQLRDFIPKTPMVEIAMAAGETGLQSYEDPMDILIFPHPPPISPSLWQETEKDFGAMEPEVGGWARFAFRTTGLVDHDEDSTAVDDVPKAAPLEAAPEAPPAPPQKFEPVPELATKAMPLTLHGLAAAKGKPAQLFPSVATTGVEVQVPRSQALPLRPVMILGPAPQTTPLTDAKQVEKRIPETPIAVRTDPKRSPPARPEPRPVNGKNRKPGVRILEPERKELPRREPEQRPVVKVPVKQPMAILSPDNGPDLGLPSLSMPASGGVWSRLPAAGKIAAAAVLVLVAASLIGLVMKGSGTAASTGPHIVEAGPALPAAASGWITDWGAESGVRRQRQISVLRPSLNLTDYRMEFQAQIESKAIGWVFRAMDSKNFYVSKLEIVKPGLKPAVALVRFAVINGEEQPRSQLPLTMAVRLDTMYKIRSQVAGDHFTTWVQDQKVDDWTDDRIKTGGVGLYNERGEQASLKGGVSVVPLVIKQ